MSTQIIDVSEHNGTIDWSKTTNKISGAIIRIGYGDDIQSQDDGQAKRNMTECSTRGIPFAVYIYSYAGTERQILSEIAHTKRMCEGFEPVAYWYDLEERRYQSAWRRAAELWKEAFGDKAGCYCWQWGFEKYIKAGRRWICAYGSNNGKLQPAYKPTLDMDGWQYTSKGTIPGINGSVDISEWYVPFDAQAPVRPAPVEFPDKTDADLAVEILFNIHGTGEARKKALGGRYTGAQEDVNRLLNGNKTSLLMAVQSYLKRHGADAIL